MKSIPLWAKLLGLIALIAAACVGLTFVPTGDVAYAPIAPIDLDGKIKVKGHVVEPLQGRLYLVGVTERTVNLLQRMLLDVSDSDVDFGPAPAGITNHDPSPRDVEAMTQAKIVAAGVALEAAGLPVDWAGTAATVEQVLPNTPAGRVLRRGDLITAVNGTAVDASVDVTRAIDRLAPGTPVTLGISHAGDVTRVRLRTIPPEEGDHARRSRLGMQLSTIGLRVNLPFDVEIDSGDVVGPSAGLAYALYLYDSQSADDLLHGRHVVVTGAISPDGRVLPVGRIRQKTIAAVDAHRDVLVVPDANGKEARAAAHDACPNGSDCIQVVPVRSVDEAIELLGLTEQELAARIGAAA